MWMRGLLYEHPSIAKSLIERKRELMRRRASNKVEALLQNRPNRIRKLLKHIAKHCRDIIFDNIVLDYFIDIILNHSFVDKLNLFRYIAAIFSQINYEAQNNIANSNGNIRFLNVGGYTMAMLSDPSENTYNDTLLSDVETVPDDETNLSYPDEQCIPKLLTICGFLSNIDDIEIMKNISFVYLHLIDINNKHDLFDDNIIVTGDLFVSNYSQNSNKLLLSGYFRRLNILLPFDVEYTIFQFMRIFNLGIKNNILEKLISLSTLHPSSSIENIILQQLLPRWIKGYDSFYDPILQRECIENIAKLISIKQDPPIQHLIDGGIGDKLVSCLRFKQNAVSQFESVRIVYSLVSGCTDVQMTNLLSCGIIDGLCGIIQQNVENEMLMFTLKCIKYISDKSGNNLNNNCFQYFEQCGGINTLQMLESNKNACDNIHILAKSIIKQYQIWKKS